MTSKQASQSGFTIVESLMAVVVVAILLTAITPVLTLSVATRVQARRVELATQAARTYINGLRTGAIDAPSTTIQLTPTQYFLEGVPAPDSTATSLANLYCVDLDNLDNDGLSFGDTTEGCTATSPKDLVLQAFRSVTPTANDPNNGYRLGLRVYRANAFQDSNPLKKNTPQNKVTQATFTGGLGDRKAPLIEMTTEIFIIDKTTYQDYCNRLSCG